MLFYFQGLFQVLLLHSALWTFIKALLGKSKVGVGVDMVSLKALLPSAIIASIYVFWAAKFLGFYTSLALVSFYFIIAL